MKAIKLFSLAMAALLLGACSNDEVAAPAGNEAGWNNEGTGFVNLAINLPTRPVVRANDVFNDGTADEYWVNDAKLILFGGTTEADATVQSAYELNKLNWNMVGNEQITSSAQIVQKIVETTSTNIYALVVLNANGVITIDNNGTLKAGETSLMSKTLAEVNTEIAKTAAATGVWNGASFLMANAPLAASATATPTTLAVVDKSKIYGTEAEAQNKPAANIFVERAQAKVTVKGATGNLGSLTTEAYEITGWAVDNTNTKSNLVRDVSGITSWNLVNTGSSLATSRMIGNAQVETGAGYRTYWGKDVNYSADNTAANPALSTLTGELAAANTIAPGNNAYCFENTMDVQGMTQNNATRVIVKAKLNGGNDFYVINGDRSIMYKTEAALKAKAIATYVSLPTVDAWIKANRTATDNIDASDFDVTYNNLNGVGAVTVATIAIADAAKTDFKTDATLPADGVTNLNAAMSIDVYNGAAYYQVFIKHFGDDLTPWMVNENGVATTDQWDKVPTAGDVYPDNATGDAENVLGRYGVVRNNWYDITVTGIKGIGSSTIPTPDTGLIDRLDSYISVKINIMPWAMRSQNVELK